MAVSDDLRQLATQDVVYLSRFYLGGQFPSPAEVFRGRLRQALSGNWIFSAFTGQNGVVGFNLGAITGTWTSGETPAGGLNVMISTQILLSNPPVTEVIVLTTVIPADFTE
jgi:hypothetical protein